MRGNSRRLLRRGKVSLPMLARAIPLRGYKVSRLDSLLYSAAAANKKGRKASGTSSESPWG